MKDAQKPDHISLTTLVGHLREGRFVIPDFQREFEWPPWDISELMRSIFRDYYIGSLLLWKAKSESFDALACEPIYGFKGNGNGAPEHIVLDGQQRLTAMYYAFMAPDVHAPNRKNRFLYFIRVNRFMEEAYDDAFHYDWTRRGENLLDDVQAQFEGHLFPLAVVGQTGWALPTWMQGYERYWHEKESSARESGEEEIADVAAVHAENARNFGEYMKDLTEQYQVAYIELDRDIELEKVCDIFTQVNSRGIRLDVFDLMNALLKPKGLQLKLMWRQAESRLEFADTPRMNVYVLQVMSILRQAYCSPKYLYYLLPGQERSIRAPDGSLRREVLVPDVSDFEARWNQAVDTLERAIKLLSHPQEFGAISAAYLPYVSILPAFASLQAAARALPPNQQLDAQRKIRHWYWASVFTQSYSGAMESTSARDFQDVKAWFVDDDAKPGVISEFGEGFRQMDLHSQLNRNSSVYAGIFNLLVLRGARDWMTGNVPQYGDLDDHHIVPKSWGHEHGLGTGIDTILNRTPLTAETNRTVISDRLPNEYLPELVVANGETTVRAALESHFISPAAFDILVRDPFSREDFDQFVAERQRTIQNAIEDLLVKERLDLEPHLRELDAETEAVELRLRSLIAETLDEASERLPPHVAQKAAARIQIAVRKNPALDPDLHQTLPGKLEYCDFRELQDTIVTKQLWPLFEMRFGTKENLAIRFDQLAELRNGIRHSRTVAEVAEKDGEAAILWFNQVLER